MDLGFDETLYFLSIECSFSTSSSQSVFGFYFSLNGKEYVNRFLKNLLKKKP